MLIPVKIVYLINGLGSGGAETMLYRLLDRLDRTSFDPQVIALLNIEGPLKQKINEIGVPVRIIGFSKKNIMKSIIELFGLLKRETPVILHTQLFASDIFGRVFGKILGTPIVITSIRSNSYPGLFRDMLLRLTERFAKRTTIVSHAGAKRFVENKVISVEKLRVIQSGIDPDCFKTKLNCLEKKKIREKLGLPTEVVILLAVGSLTIQKGYSYLFEAVSLLSKQYSEFALVVAGIGDLEKDLKELADSLRLSNRILFLGRSDNVALLMAASDIYVSSSIREGLPGVILEAMASELPVVATAVGGSPELVVDGKTGFLVPSQSPFELAAAIGKIIDLDEKQRKEMGQEGRRRVIKKFHINRMVEEYENLYLECLKEIKYI